MIMSVTIPVLSEKGKPLVVRRPIQTVDGDFGYLELPEGATEAEWRAAAEEYWSQHGGKPQPPTWPAHLREEGLGDPPPYYLGIGVKEGGYLGLVVKGGPKEGSDEKA